MKVVYNWNESLLLWKFPFYASNLQAEKMKRIEEKNNKRKKKVYESRL